MPKKITQSQQTGRTGEVFVGYLFQSLGQTWHESKSDFAIDSHVEWRRSDTGELQAALLAFRSKHTPVRSCRNAVSFNILARARALWPANIDW